MPRRTRTANVPARWLAGALIGILVVVTGALTFAAVERTAGTAEDADAPAPVPSFTLGPRPTITPDPTSPPVDPGGAAIAQSSPPGPNERFLAIGSDVIWRATAGECGGAAPVIERSTDAGQTWANVTPSYRGIGRVASLDPLEQVQAEVIGAIGPDCETQALRTFTQGQFWDSYPDALAASRYLDPQSPSTVVTPGGTVSAPCDQPRSFRAAGDIIALVCDGTAQRLQDGAWAPFGASGVSALSVVGGTVLTASAQAGCDGVAVSRWTGADLTTETPLGCAAGADAARPLAIAGTADAALVWSGDLLISPVP